MNTQGRPPWANAASGLGARGPCSLAVVAGGNQPFLGHPLGPNVAEFPGPQALCLSDVLLPSQPHESPGETEVLVWEGGDDTPLRAQCLRGGAKATGLFRAAPRGPEDLGCGAQPWGLQRVCKQRL